MDTTLFRLLQEQVAAYLQALELVLEGGDDEAVLSVARGELIRLVASWQALLELHQPDGRGLCPWCASRWRLRKNVCSVWRAAYAYFLRSTFDWLNQTAAEAKDEES